MSAASTNNRILVSHSVAYINRGQSGREKSCRNRPA
ncbi:hypothetical protein SLEP1_g59354 [Rubroshorea leprosula]|uniref:Uncharacterized protein n=1 Tax=Rubroshorea leprosula TaxID=152421 RepID=A0AAV5MS39_9ROSI|nr:hypothetical protein SLEP1_g59354 [Rubroshorea leprosula]